MRGVDTLAGNAPTMMAWDDLARVAPKWMNLSVAIFNDEETAKEWGWVQEMCVGCCSSDQEMLPAIRYCFTLCWL